jgi:hypothetical protein
LSALAHNNRKLFSAIYNAYIAYLADPFSPGLLDGPQEVAPPLTSRRLLAAIDAIAQPAAP